MLLWLPTAAVLGWPQMYLACFPTSVSERIMGVTGEQSTGVLVVGSAGGLTAHCGSGGAIVMNGQLQGSNSEEHTGCPGSSRVTANAGSRVIVRSDAAKPVSVLCAHQDWDKWKYHSTSPLDSLSAEQAAVVVVGGGMAAAAVARAAQEAGASTLALAASPASTSSRSTGVLWFPLGRTLIQLQQAHGYGEANGTHIEAYLATAEASFQFADRHLNLTDYTGGFPIGPPDYTAYAPPLKGAPPHTGPQSYQAAACGFVGCGGTTVSLLRGPEGMPRTGTVTRVERVAAGKLAVYYTVASGPEQVTVASAVVFASGGSPSAAHPQRLASPENTGVHLRVAADLGLPLSRTDVFWHLEFERVGGTEGPRWFAQRCVPPDTVCTGYDVCADYNRRSSTCYNGTGGNWYQSADNGGAVVCTEGTSGAWWATLFATYNYAETGLECAGKELAGGIIDSKAGFLLDPATMASIADSQIYAAGTTAAHVLGNTYFAPGATLGWAVHSGRLAGTAAAQVALASPTRDAEHLSKQVPHLFMLAALLFLCGIMAHVLGRKVLAAWPAAEAKPASGILRLSRQRPAAAKSVPVSKRVMQLHYLLMPAGTAVLLAAVIRASQTEGKPMASASPYHQWAGRIGVVWVLLQSAAGAYLKLPGKWSQRRGSLHRTSGWLLLALICTLFVTSRLAAALYGLDRQAVLARATAFTLTASAAALWAT